jgi:hypothetical protein
LAAAYFYHEHAGNRSHILILDIADSDAGASAYTNAAIDQAYRAVQEQVKGA